MQRKKALTAPLHTHAFTEEHPDAFLPLHSTGPLIPGAEPFLYGAGDVGCLMVHGYTASPFEMRGLARYLAERGMTAGALLLEGHGTVPEDLQDKTWLDWYASVNRGLDYMLSRCSKVYLVGLSLGGALSLYTAAHRGDDLAGIVPISSPIYIPHGVSYLLKSLNGSMPFMNKPYRDIEDPQAREEHISYPRSPVNSTASLVEFLVEVRGALPRIKIPTLVVYARHDHVVPGVSSHYIYARLGTPRKHMLALHNGFHICTVDTDREKLYSSIDEFITGNAQDVKREA